MRLLRSARVAGLYKQLHLPWLLRSSFFATSTSPASNDSSAMGCSKQQQDLLELYQRYTKPASVELPHLSDPIQHAKSGETVAVHGFIGRRKRGGGSWLTLVPLTTANGSTIQVASTSTEMLDQLKAIPVFSPVRAIGTVRLQADTSKWSLQLHTLEPLNEFPADIIVDETANFKPVDRHLQIRFHRNISTRLRIRSALKRALFDQAADLGYTDVDTPLLFKPTADGAREFLVPTRRAGEAYALAQSPQQYKQVLMASGIDRYMQFTRCFRDEGLRADRQHEFTQFDLERAFATSADIIQDVERMFSLAWDQLRSEFGSQLSGLFAGASGAEADELPLPCLKPPFRRMTYYECIDKYGTDKPDLRIPGTIFRFPDNEPIHAFVGMTTPLMNPIVEACQLPNTQGCSVAEVEASLQQFMRRLHKAFAQNPDGAPSILVFNPARAMNGFSSLGFEGWAALTTGPAAATAGTDQLAPGDIVIFQARDRHAHPGSGTRLGQLRTQAWAEIAGRQATGDEAPNRRLEILWVVDFPMFLPDAALAPGNTGLSPSHHLFTAPKTAADAAALFTAPLAATADNYDLVLNGLEVGGGSRRIHIAAVQEYVMRTVLGLPEARIAEFAHLLRALRAGCPPHAGFAFGFDRLCATLSGSGSVRDVLAFPKSMKGHEPFAGAPARVTNDQLAPYHVRLVEPA